MARPSKYNDDVKPKIKFIQPLINAGFSQKDIAVMLGINEDTLYEYKKKHKEFSECFDKKDIAREVENTYVNRLLGKYKAEKEIYEPDKNGDMKLVRIERYEIPFKESAYKHYLSTVSPDKWREKTLSGEESIISNFINSVVGVHDDAKDD